MKELYKRFQAFSFGDKFIYSNAFGCYRHFEEAFSIAIYEDGTFWAFEGSHSPVKFEELFYLLSKEDQKVLSFNLDLKEYYYR